MPVEVHKCFNVYANLSNMTLFSTYSLVFSCKKKQQKKNYIYQQVSNIYLHLGIFSTLEQLFPFYKFQEC